MMLRFFILIIDQYFFIGFTCQLQQVIFILEKHIKFIVIDLTKLLFDFIVEFI